jgi:hypothetical protein
MAWGKLIHVENLKLKISWHCPFKPLQIMYWISGSTVIVPNTAFSNFFTCKLEKLNKYMDEG